MLSPIIIVLLLTLMANPLVVSRDNQRTTEVLLELLGVGSKCPSTIVVYEDKEKFHEDNGLLVDEFVKINQQSNPVTLIEISSLNLMMQNHWTTEPKCRHFHSANCDIDVCLPTSETQFLRRQSDRSGKIFSRGDIGSLV